MEDKYQPIRDLIAKFDTYGGRIVNNTATSKHYIGLNNDMHMLNLDTLMLSVYARNGFEDWEDFRNHRRIAKNYDRNVAATIGGIKGTIDGVCILLYRKISEAQFKDSLNS